MTVAYIGVGSNVGDREAFCRRAVAALSSHRSISVLAVSGLYETSPVGGPPQRSFINLVAKISTEMTPRGLLEECRRIEQVLGREESDIRWGPRVVDLDILLYGDEKVNEPNLEIPHPRLAQRRFTLVPLLEIEPDAADPWGTPYRDSLDEAEGEVERLKDF